MDRKKCYRLTHPLSKISGYATGIKHKETDQTWLEMLSTECVFQNCYYKVKITSN